MDGIRALNQSHFCKKIGIVIFFHRLFCSNDLCICYSPLPNILTSDVTSRDEAYRVGLVLNLRSTLLSSFRVWARMPLILGFLICKTERTAYPPTA